MPTFTSRPIHVLVFLAAAFASLPAAADWSSGLAAFKAGEFDAAKKDFQALIDTQPDWYGGYLMMGQTLLRQSKPGEALEPLRRAAQLAPTDVPTALAQAQAAYFEKQWSELDRTLDRLDAAGLAKPQQATFYRLRGQAAQARSNHTAAIDSLARAVELEPRDASLHHQLAVAALHDKRYDLAIEHLTAAKKLAPGDVKVLANLTRARYAHANELSGEEKAPACRQAAADGHELLKHQGDADTLLLVGQVELCADEPEKAAIVLAKAVAQTPDDWRPAYYLARSQSLKQRWQAAEKSLKPFSERRLGSETDQRIASLMGFIYEGQQRYDLAIEHYERSGDGEKVARARQAQEITRRNAELERIQREIEAIENAQGELDQAAQEIGHRL